MPTGVGAEALTCTGTRGAPFWGGEVAAGCGVTPAAFAGLNGTGLAARAE